MQMADVHNRTDGQRKPDVMNDPIYEMDSKGKGKSIEDADTCRICRGEGSTDEPLFYPCKCSGSIKFVHQGCLMEWLSHSQKKHCELCKTSFRFTKLYDSHMPSTVPLPVFLRQAMVHTFKNFLTWTRWHLVVFVWLGWVPWCMRTVWRGLFWVGDGGWINWSEMERQSLMGTQKQLTNLASQSPTPANSGILPLEDYIDSSIFSKVSRYVTVWGTPISPSISLNFTAGRPTLFGIAKRLVQDLVRYDSVDVASQASTIYNGSTSIRSSQRSPSWLSELNLLRSLTPWRLVNNVIIDVLEGQLITLFVCVAFILIFLIREWVVQQQPGINMGAAANAAAAVERQAEQLPAQPRVPREQLEQQNADGEMQDTARNNNTEPLELVGGEALVARPRPRREGSHFIEHEQDSEELNALAQDHANPVDINANESIFGPFNNGDVESNSTKSEPGPSNLTSRPGMPTRDALARATEIRRTLEEQSGASDRDWPGLDVFMELWKRAKSNPTEVLRIIQEEGREEELSWVVSAMRRLESTPTDKNFPGDDLDVNDATSDLEEDHSGEQRSDASNESWQVVLDAESGLEIKQADVSQEDLPSNQANHHNGLENTAEATLDSSAPSTNFAVQTEGHRTEDSLTQSQVSDKGKKRQSLTSLENSDDHAIGTNGPEEQLPVPAGPSGYSNHSNLTSRQALEDENPETLEELELMRSRNLEAENLQGAPNLQTTTTAPSDFGENLMDWLWGGVSQTPPQPAEQGQDDERVVDNIANEAPFVPVGHGQLEIEGVNAVENLAQDPEVLRAAAEAGLNPNDPDVVEEGEDLEGIMELIGMQGPLAGLVQNGMFSAVLISLTVFFGIWVPYIMGKLMLVLLANPVSLLVKVPLRWASTIADIFIDSCIFAAACAFYWIDTIIHLSCTPIGWFVPFIAKMNENKILAATARSYAHSALGRLAKLFVASGDSLSDSDIPIFSIIAHESLRAIKESLAGTTNHIVNSTVSLCHSLSAEDLTFILACKNLLGTMTTMIGNAAVSLNSLIQKSVRLLPSLLNINPLRISLDIPQRTIPLDYSLAQWNTKDRILAILLGYLSFSIAGAVYLKIKAALKEKREGEKPEGTVTDVLFQAGGVMKVILIISIEMIVFPLYCGWLLDAALLPLFENASAMSRLRFTLNSPATSLFVHWFVGTCYMFHFALFVAMCRKIMRSGVLYFIRDPDDPTFHPVRDVLERNVTTQLKKIAFSALVYGALVIICLGGVVWGISLTFNGIFPIHWSSNEPILEFPVDLLFYNFLMPLVVKFFRPSKGLGKMYGWWFRRCARMLRLTEFLFGERKEDEEGHYVNRKLWNSFSLRGNSVRPASRCDHQLVDEGSNTEDDFIHDGMYVRAPSSDQVRIPKGTRTFVEVDENGKRADGLPDNEWGLHGHQNRMFSKVYIPPFFRLRISAFIFLIWLFAAITGVVFTVIPLLFGRLVFAHLTPSHLRMNDIYAFSIGIYLLGGPVYLAFQYRHVLWNIVRASQSLNSSILLSPISHALILLKRVHIYTLHTFRLIYFYTAFGLLLPSLFALVMELYLIVPIHTYFSASSASAPDRHTIHFVQDWTLGVLYIKMAGRLILWHAASRPAQALRAITASPRSWLDPDVRLATRAFIFPATALMLIALGTPLGFGWVANHILFPGTSEIKQACVYRYVYPAVLAGGMAAVFALKLAKAVEGWRNRVRDEVYLIGERLHNFGEGKRGRVGGVRRVRTA